jgi:hypothetical protein
MWPLWRTMDRIKRAKDQPRSVFYFDEAVRERCAQMAKIGRPAGPRPAPAPEQPPTRDEWTTLVKFYRESGAWAHRIPSPDCLGCEAPPDILASYGCGPLARRR